MAISYRVMREVDVEEGVFYKIACACGSDDHSWTVEFEVDRDLGMLIMNVYLDMEKVIRKPYKAYWSVWKEIWERVKVAAKFLATGCITMEHTLLVQGEEHISAFIEALVDGKKKLEGKVVRKES